MNRRDWKKCDHGRRLTGRFLHFFLYAAAAGMLLLGTGQSVMAGDYADEYVPENFSDFHGDELGLYAKSAVIIDGDSGRILYGKSANMPALQRY